MSNVKTKIANLINPEVMAPLVDSALTAELKFAPLCIVDTTLVGTAGDTVSLPKYAYIGDAADIAEGEAIPLELLSSTTTTVTIKKAGKGVEITDEAALSGYGDPIGTANKQLGISIASKVETDILGALATVKVAMTVTDTSVTISSDVVADALVKFGEKIEGTKALLIAPAQLATLRKSEDWLKATEMGVKALIDGTVGMIHGCQVVVSERIKAVTGTPNTFTNYIVKPGALAIFLKRKTDVETDRDIVNKTTVITADKHYVAYLADESKAIKLVVKE